MTPRADAYIYTSSHARRRKKTACSMAVYIREITRYISLVARAADLQERIACRACAYFFLRPRDDLSTRVTRELRRGEANPVSGGVRASLV